MTKVEGQLIGFSTAQIIFMFFLKNTHLIKVTKMGWLEHPITKQNVAPVFEYQTPKFVNIVSTKISDWLIGKKGHAILEQMISYEVMKEREE